jgi:hypothetical protein
MSILLRVRPAPGLQEIGKDTPLSLFCLSFGPLIYAASAEAVTIMLFVAGVTLILLRPSGVPVIAKSIRGLLVVAPLLAWMLVSGRGHNRR